MSATDWHTKAQAAISRLQAYTKLFPKERTLGLIDFFAAKRSVYRSELLMHGSPHFIQVVLGYVTSAVHGGGKVPRRGGWYRVRAGMPYVIDPDFAVAWLELREHDLVERDLPDVRSKRSKVRRRTT